jgi:hypothetical protein
LAVTTALGLKEKSGRRVDVVFVDTMLDPLHMTHADLQEVLQVRFDIKICSMAWSGSELYFPCMEREGIINKITWVCDIGRVSGPQYSRYDVLMQRLEKYRERGFKFIFEEDWKDFGFGTRDKL